MDSLKADETLDFHNQLIREVALGERCPNSANSAAYILTSPLGHVYTNACPNGLHCVKLYGDTNYDKIKWDTKVDFIRASSFLPSNTHVKQLKKWLQTYFRNPLDCKDIELTFCGLADYGEFNSKIWMTIYDTCPAGELMSYRELGERSGYGPGASKVVGYAINKNPYMLVVGDHRVVKATGEIWCENDSQRNKLRRLLVKYEIGFTDDSFDDALLKVKERNSSSKSTRARATNAKAKAKLKPKARGAKVKEETMDEQDEPMDDEDEALGQDAVKQATIKQEPIKQEPISQKKKATTRGVKKPARKKVTTTAATRRSTRRRRKADESDEEEADEDDDNFINDDEDDD